MKLAGFYCLNRKYPEILTTSVKIFLALTNRAYRVNPFFTAGRDNRTDSTTNSNMNTK